MPRVLKEKTVRVFEDFVNVGTGGLTLDEPIVASTYTEPEGEGNPESQELGSLDPSSSSSSSDSDPDDDMPGGRQSGVVLPSDEQRDEAGQGYVSSQSTEGDENQDLHPDDPSVLLEQVRAGILMIKEKQRKEVEEEEEEEEASEPSSVQAEQGSEQEEELEELDLRTEPWVLLYEGLFGPPEHQRGFFDEIYDKDRSNMSLATIVLSCAKFVGLQNPRHALEKFMEATKYQPELIHSIDIFKDAIEMRNPQLQLDKNYVSTIFANCFKAFLEHAKSKNRVINEKEKKKLDDWFKTAETLLDKSLKQNLMLDTYIQNVNREDFLFDRDHPMFKGIRTLEEEEEDTTVLYSMDKTTNALFNHPNFFVHAKDSSKLESFAKKTPIFVMRRRRYVFNPELRGDCIYPTESAELYHSIVSRLSAGKPATVLLSAEGLTDDDFESLGVRFVLTNLFKNECRFRMSPVLNAIWQQLFYERVFNSSPNSVEDVIFMSALGEAGECMARKAQRRDNSAGLKFTESREGLMSDVLLSCDYKKMVWEPGTARKLVEHFVEMTGFSTHEYNLYMKKVKSSKVVTTDVSQAAANIAAAAADRQKKGGNDTTKQPAGTGASAAAASTKAKRGSKQLDEDSPAQKREAKRKRKEEAKNAKRPKN
eukprot:SAG11_NODE_3325_length_2522_cov_174.445316_2_plen_650_part_00